MGEVRYLDAELNSFLQRATNDGFLVYYIGPTDAPKPEAVALVRHDGPVASVLVAWSADRAVAFMTREGIFETTLKCAYVTWDSESEDTALNTLRELETTEYGGGRPYPRPDICEVSELDRFPIWLQTTWVRQ